MTRTSIEASGAPRDLVADAVTTIDGRLTHAGERPTAGRAQGAG